MGMSEGILAALVVARARIPNDYPHPVRRCAMDVGLFRVSDCGYGVKFWEHSFGVSVPQEDFAAPPHLPRSDSIEWE